MSVLLSDTTSSSAKKTTEKKQFIFGAGVYKIAAGGASLCTMSCKIEYYFAAMKMQPTWTEALDAFPVSLDIFISRYQLKTCWDLARLTDEQIAGFYKDDAQALDQMIQLRNKCYWGNQKRQEPGAVAQIVNGFDKAPVIVSGWQNYYYCGRHVGEAKLFGPRTPESIPGVCGPRHGPQCAACIITWAHVPVPCQKEYDQLPVFWRKCTDGLKDTDGKPLFGNDAARNLFAWYKLGLVRELRDLNLEAVVRNSEMTRAQKVAMIDTISRLKAGTHPHWGETAQTAQSLTEKAALVEAELLRAELRKSQEALAEREKYRQEIVLANGILVRQYEHQINELEAQVRAKRKREADVVGVLAGMSEGRVDGSYTYVKQAAHHAKLLAVRLQEQARDMHADIVRCAVAEKELVAKRGAAEACAPDAFRCCISQDLMVDPVLVGETGHSYERAAIEQWFEEKRKQKLTLTDPKTRAALLTDQVIPNHALRQAIEAFVASQPTSQSTDDAPDEGWAVEL
jgi:hypothetical protein